MIIDILFGIHKSIYFNFKYFSFSVAIKLPVLLSNNVSLKTVKGKVILDKVRTGIVKIGFNDVGIFDKKRDKCIWDVQGKVHFAGGAVIGHGSKVSVLKSGILSVGQGFCLSASSSIVCAKKVTFGNECLVSWDVLIMDTDFHKVFDKNKVYINPPKEIFIDDNVWIGCRCTILKGVYISKNCVIGATTTISKSVAESKVVIAGKTQNIVKRGISWKG